MENKFLLISLEDEKSKKLAEVLSSKTCKKIIDYLAETNQASQNDISKAIKSPLNTIEYNLKKLIETGIVEKTTNFFWSIKGKKIPTYKLSNKSIIISSNSKNSKDISSKIKSIVPVVLISGAITFLIRQYFLIKQKSNELILAGIETKEYAQDMLLSVAENTPQRIAEDTIMFAQPHPAWIWFLTGALLTIIIFTLWNWRKI